MSTIEQPILERNAEASIVAGLQESGQVAIEWKFTDCTQPSRVDTRDELKITNATRVSINENVFSAAYVYINLGYRESDIFEATSEHRRELALRKALAEMEAALPRLRMIVAALDAKDQQQKEDISDE